jgi:ferric-dicitrate binding protein FerR (iron transport regulator)
MELARQYIRRADGLWRRHKARAVILALAAAACAIGWLARQGAVRILGHLKVTRQGETDEH